MRGQILFSRKNKKNITNLSSAELAKMCPYKVDILLQVFPVILKLLSAQCDN